MPEILTKHPVLVLKVLNGSGIQCGVGAKQQILVHCPQANFCSTATGELCVYGLKDIPKMTQITSKDLLPFSNPNLALISWPGFFLFIIIFVIGLFAGRSLTKDKTAR